MQQVTFLSGFLPACTRPQQTFGGTKLLEREKEGVPQKCCTVTFVKGLQCSLIPIGLARPDSGAVMGV